MAQATVDFQKLLELEQERHSQQEEEELIKPKLVPFPLEKTMKELNQNIFLDDKAIKSYSSTKIKARNFLTNVSYNRITMADYRNVNFVIDCFTFMVLYLNPFYLERKFETNVEREFINTLWTFLMPDSLYRHITENQNMKTLNKIKIKYQDAKNIVVEFTQNNEGNINVLSEFLEKNGVLYQFLFGNLFPKVFCRVNDYGISAKTLFATYYHNFNVQKHVIDWQSKNVKQEEIDEHDEITSPLNMTQLNDENKENVIPKQEQKEQKKLKRKIKNEELKKQKREVKKQKLLRELDENTEKLSKIKKQKSIK